MPIYSDSLKGKLLAYITRELRMREYRNGWYKGKCLLCGKDDKLGIHLDNARANCFVCGNHGNPIQYIKEANGFDTFNEVYQLLNLFEGEYVTKVEIKKPEVKTKGVQLPESFKLLIFGDSLTAQMARQYIKDRGFRVKALASKGVGYCTAGEYAGCIILPFYENGKLIYFQGRRFIQIGQKFKNPREEDFGLGKNQIIYNIDALSIYNKIRIVESVFNAETLGLNTISIGGKKISEWQFSKIVRSSCKRVSIILDPDAIDEALKLGLRLCEHKEVKVTLLPKGKDVNDIGRKETKRLEALTPWQNYQQLYKRFIEL